MPRKINKRLRKQYRDKTCFDMVMFSDQKIIEFLEEDAFNFVIEIDKKIFCGNKKDMLTRRTIKNGNLVYLCVKAGDSYDIRREDIVDTIPYLRLESVGLSQGQVLISYYNIIEVIINSDDQIFVCKHMYDHLGNLLSSKSTVSLSVYINKGSVVSAAHCQPGGNYPIYSVYSVTHPDEREKLNHDFIIPRSIKHKDINEIRRDIDIRLGLDKDESVYVYFPEEWSMVVRNSKPDYGLSEEQANWWNIKDGDRYRLQNDLIEIDDLTGEESNMEYLMMRFLENMYDRGETTLEVVRETLENQIQKPEELEQSIDDFIRELENWGNADLDAAFIQSDEESDEETEVDYDGFKIIPEILNLGDQTPWQTLRPQTTVEIDVYTHNGTEPLPRYPTMIFIIDEDVDLSLATIQQRANSDMVDAFAPIDVYLRRLDGANMNVGKLEFIHPAGYPVRGEIRLNAPSEDFPQPIEERPEFQAPPTSPVLSAPSEEEQQQQWIASLISSEADRAPSPALNPRRLDFGDSSEDSGSSGEESVSSEEESVSSGEESEDYSLQPYIQEDKYSDKDYVSENYAKYTNILYNEYIQTTNLKSKDAILNHYAVFKFIMSKLKILNVMLNAGLSHPIFSYEELEETVLDFENTLISKYGSRSDANFQVREDMQKAFDTFMGEIGWNIEREVFE